MGSEKFNENYKILHKIATSLREQEEPDIDALVPMIKEATKAYSKCKSRLDAVKLALKEHFANQESSI